MGLIDKGKYYNGFASAIFVDSEGNNYSNYVDKNNKKLSNDHFADTYSKFDEWCVVANRGQTPSGFVYNYINNDGELLSTEGFKSAYAFDSKYKTMRVTRMDGKMYLLDTNGNQLTSTGYYYIGPFDKNGWAICLHNGWGEKYNMINPKGEELLTQCAFSIHRGNHDTYTMTKTNVSGTFFVYCIYDKNGHQLYNEPFKAVGSFSDGWKGNPRSHWAAVKFMDGSWNYINTLGEIYSDDKFLMAKKFNCYNQAEVKTADNVWQALFCHNDGSIHKTAQIL